MEKITYTVPLTEDGVEVLTLLRGRLGISMGLLRSLKHIEDGIMLDGNRVTVRQRVTAGQRLEVLSETREQEIVPMEGDLNILYEDNALMVVDKEAGLAVHPSRGHYTDTLANRIVWYYQNKGERSLFRAVNRLDKGTGGLLVLAKNRHMAQRLSRQFAAGEVVRRYQAVVEGTGLGAGTIDLPIGRRPGYGIMRHVSPEGEQAVTHFATVKEGNGRSLLDIRLETGRTHQIRVHFSHMGHPVVGDFMYGTELPGLEGHALYAYAVELCHPITGDHKVLETGVPQQLLSML